MADEGSLQQPNQDKWLTDEIVSVTPSSDRSARHDPDSVRPPEDGAYLRLQYISIFVRDQERSLRFFTELIGFRLVLDVRFASGNRWIEVAPPDGTASLALVLPRPEEESFVGHSGIVTLLTEDVEGKFNEWSARGVHFNVPLQKPGWGGTFCRFEDPDGNAFVLAGFDDATRAIEARRKAAAARIEEERRAAQELEIARQVQLRLFPQDQPLIPGLDYAGLCVQARAVGGDYYDFLELGEGRLALIVGDISGKGIAASLLMASLQASLRSQHLVSATRADQLLASVNRLLFRNTDPAAYATLFFAEVEPGSGRLHFANCGHVAALLLRNDGSVERLEPTSTVLGLFPDWTSVIGQTDFVPGEVLLLCTDGITEATDDSGVEFGAASLITSLKANRKLPAKALAQALVNEALRFGGTVQQDDITLIVAKKTT